MIGDVRIIAMEMRINYVTVKFWQHKDTIFLQIMRTRRFKPYPNMII